MSSADEKLKGSYKDLLDEFGEEVVKRSIDSWKERLDSFIISRGLSDKVRVSDRNLYLAMLSYFSDIKRIKPYHVINDVNDVKIHSYLAYWIMRKKPLQILSDFDSCERVNERFVAFMLTDFLLRDWIDTVLSGEAKEQFENFTKTLYYTFSYRDYSAQSIELVLLGFLAGVAVGENIPTKYFTT
jgi:hypothetical protein